MQVPIAMLFSSVAMKTQPGNCIDDKYLRQQLAVPEVEIFLVPWEAVWEEFEEVERKLRPAQTETTAAFRSIPKTNSSPQQPPGGNQLGGSGLCVQRRLVLPVRGGYGAAAVTWPGTSAWCPAAVTWKLFICCRKPLQKIGPKQTALINQFLALGLQTCWLFA